MASSEIQETSTAAAADGPAAHDRIEPYVWKIAGVVILGMIMSILDTTIVNVALRTLSENLHSSISQIQWVVTGYLLSLAAVIPVTGWAARRYGAKRVYITSLVLFTLGSALCAVASSTTSLMLFRVLQGVGGGMIMPVGQLIMAQVAGPEADGPRDGLRRDAGDARADPRSGRRRRDPAEPALAVDLPRQRAGRHRRVRALRGECCRTPTPARPGGSTSVGLALLSTATTSLVYGLRELGTNASFTAPTVIWPTSPGSC